MNNITEIISAKYYPCRCGNYTCGAKWTATESIDNSGNKQISDSYLECPATVILNNKPFIKHLSTLCNADTCTDDCNIKCIKYLKLQLKKFINNTIINSINIVANMIKYIISPKVSVVADIILDTEAYDIKELKNEFDLVIADDGFLIKEIEINKKQLSLAAKIELICHGMSTEHNFYVDKEHGWSFEC